MILRISSHARSALAQTFRDLLDGGAGAATIEVRSGTIPNAADDIETGQLLAVLTCSDPCGSESSGVLTLDEIEEEKRALATGRATWARAKDGDGQTIFDCDISNQRGGGMLELNTTVIVERGPVRIDEFIIEIMGSE